MERVKTVARGLLLCGLLARCGGECPEPVYRGGTTDEAWRALLDAEPRVQEGAVQAATLMEPSANTPLCAGEAPPTLRWSSPLALHLPPHGPPRRRVLAGGSLRSWLSRALEGTAQALLPVARAHGTPLSGDAYLVRLSVPGQRCPLEHFTTELHWPLSQEEWDAVRAGAPRSLRFTLTSAEFRDNSLTAGPYRPAVPFTLQVEP